MKSDKKAFLRKSIRLTYQIGGVLAIVSIIIAAWQFLIVGKRNDQPVSTHLSEPIRAEIKENLRHAAMSFEANQGQVAEEIKYLSRGKGYGLFLTSNEAVFMLKPAGSQLRQARQNENKIAENRPFIVKMKVNGSNKASAITGQELLTAKSNYLIGKDPQKWKTDISQYSRVRYSDIYSGIDLVFYGNQQHLEYDFVVSPNIDYRQISLSFEGLESLKVDSNGELLLKSTEGELRQPKPIIYQIQNGEKREIAGGYVIAENQVKFEISNYDQNQTLYIDPVMIYSTYLGGTDDEAGNGIEADASGNAYVTGITYSPDFEVKNAFQGRLRGVSNAFASKFDPNGNLVYSTYLGGSGEDVGFAITVDAQGFAYVVGTTDSSDFPTTAGSFQPQRNVRLDGFLTKLSQAGNALVYSTFLGGGSDDVINSVAVDSNGSAYVTGETYSSNFPVRNAFQSSLRGSSDSFVTKFAPNGASLIYSTYLGGDGFDTGFGIVVDGAGSAYLTGITYSLNFPTRNPIQAALAGTIDAFITKLNASGNALIYSTYFGGTDDDGGYGIGIDSNLNAFVAGFTSSTDFPTKNPFQAQSGGGDDAFVLRVDPAGALVYSSYLGGSGHDRAFDLAADKNGNAYVVGRTVSFNFPTVDAIQNINGSGRVVDTSLTEAALLRPSIQKRQATSTLAGFGREAIHKKTDFATESQSNAVSPEGSLWDGFVVKIGINGNIIYATYLGGNDEEKTFAVAVDNLGNAYVTGLTTSVNFPVRIPIHRFLFGQYDAYVTKIADLASTQTSVSAASYTAASLAPDSIVSTFGSDFTTQTQTATSLPLPTTLAGIIVRVKDSSGIEHAAPLFYASPSQINYLMPAGVAAGQARVVVEKSSVVLSTETVGISTVSPGLFAANANGRGVAAAVVVRVAANNSQTTESMLRYDQALGQFVPVPIDLSQGQVFLLVFGTGLRHITSLDQVTATVGGVPVQVTYAGEQPNFVGLDQVNLLIPQSLSGKGEVEVVLSVGGKATNKVTASFK